MKTCTCPHSIRRPSKRSTGYGYTRIPWNFQGPENRGVPTNGNLDETEERRAEVVELAKQDIEKFTATLNTEEKADLAKVAEKHDAAEWPLLLTYTMREGGNWWRQTPFTSGRDPVVEHWRESLEKLKAKAREWEQVDVDNATSDVLFEGIQDLITTEAWYWERPNGYGKSNEGGNGIAAHGAARGSDGQLNNFLTKHAPGFSSGPFLTGMSSPTMDEARNLDAIAGKVRENPAIFELVITTTARRLMQALRDHPEGKRIGCRPRCLPRRIRVPSLRLGFRRADGGRGSDRAHDHVKEHGGQ